MIDTTPYGPQKCPFLLEYVVAYTQQHGTSPIITFDQQLWWLAFKIIEAQPSLSPLHQIVLVFSGFYTQISFLGAIGSLMAASGLSE